MQTKYGRLILFAAMLAGFAATVVTSPAQSTPGAIRIVKLQGTVEELKTGGANWTPATSDAELRPNDQLRTGANSSVSVTWPESSVVSFGALTQLQVLSPDSSNAEPGLQLARGVLSFFHRDKPGRLRVLTRAAVAGVEGTEFVIEVDDGDRTTLSVIDGRVVFTNAVNGLVLTNGQQAVAAVGTAPVPSPGFVVNDVLQWAFYYPAVLDLADLRLSPAEQQALADSLAAYRAGDLLTALARYPAGRQPGSDDERVYHAALLLSVGQVTAAENELGGLTGADQTARPQRAAAALRLLIATVKRQPGSPAASPQTATEWLAASYFEQSLASGDASLRAALDDARKATELSPQSGFAWERVAELEFSFGRTVVSEAALDLSLDRAPRNAEALALRGFLEAAQGRTEEGIRWFNQALAVDSALGNAWLGRGLCRIHLGDSARGREDLLIAAALEPQRSILRSYLGKAYGDAGDDVRAIRELSLAKGLDTNDPTPWFYSALLNQENRRINDAVRDLEKSKDLNTNRAVYRSQLLLDQDQAARSANLAAMYRDAGMFDVGLREAGRAVNEDYANYSGHLFLANSYEQLRDPNGINLRYETPESAEFLVASLLAPVNAGPFSPTISQQEYSPLFERSQLGVASSTEYLSRGAWTESGAVYGNTDQSSFDFETFYRWDPGQRTNNDITQRQFALTLKQRLTSKDTIYANVQEFEGQSGDQFQYYNISQANPSVRDNEKQQPIVGIGYHHEWSPGVHTLFYATRLDDSFSLTNLTQPSLVATRPDIIGMPGVTHLTGVAGMTSSEIYDDRLAIYSGELQQIFEQTAHMTVLGARLQYGHFHTENTQGETTLGFLFPDPPAPAAQQDTVTLFNRLSFYGYHEWQIVEPVQLIAGAVYDRVTFPENFETVPISANEKTVHGVLPKAGLIWTPFDDATVRFAYTRSIEGASIDQSIQLEPAQVAGFVQSFRSVMPESAVGPTAGAKFETYDLSLEKKFHTGTYLALAGEMLNSDNWRTIGAFDNFPDSTVFDFPVPSGLPEHLDYEEKSLLFTANQLLAQEWSLGLKYRISQAVLHDNFVSVPDGLLFSGFTPRQKLEGILDELDLMAFYNNPNGLFGEAEALWYGQSNRGYTPDEPGDHFWQFNAFAGYRLPRRRVEATVGILNLANQDYNLNPLNIYNELPRKRTIAVRLQINL